MLDPNAILHLCTLVILLLILLTIGVVLKALRDILGSLYHLNQRTDLLLYLKGKEIKDDS